MDGRITEVSEIEVKELKGDGDFRSEESVELLKEADIVVTNPPFSLFKEFVPLLMRYKKKFIILGTTNAITYKVIFPLIKDSKMWPGTNNSGSMEFTVPPHTEFHSKDAGRIDEDGIKYISIGNVCWWTNLEHNFENEYIELVSSYKENKDKYPKYDNYDAINVDKVAEIPKDYKGAMGVPIGFIGQWNPEQFEIIGQGRNGLADKEIRMSKKFVDDYYAHGGTGSYGEGSPLLGYYDSDGKATIPYMRILIRNKYLNTEIYTEECNHD